MRGGEKREAVNVSQAPNRLQIVGLTLAAIYIPYVFVFFSGAVAGNLKSALSIWPIFPGLALSALTSVRGIGFSVLLTLLLLTASLYGTLRFTRFFWVKIVGLMLASSGLVYVVLLLLRA